MARAWHGGSIGQVHDLRQDQQRVSLEHCAQRYKWKSSQKHIKYKILIQIDFLSSVFALILTRRTVDFDQTGAGVVWYDNSQSESIYPSAENPPGTAKE